MVRILGWEIRRIEVDHTNYKCDVCGGHKQMLVPAPTRELRGVDVCSRCEADGEVRRLLDLQYWRTHPEHVPACMNCGKSVPPEQLTFAVCFDWYFCLECSSNGEVLQRFEELRERASK